jgi:hypothetical protein
MARKIVQTKTIKNFFTEEEIQIIENIVKENPDFDTPNMASEPHMDPSFIERKIFYFGEDSRYQAAHDILRKRIDEHFGTDVIIGGWHILTAYWPYRAHTDGVFGEYGIDENHYGAWTLIIPLDNYPSATILFNEHSFETKLMPLWKQDKKPKNAINEEFRKRYLSLEAQSTVDVLSVEQVFEWEKNTCFAASRYKWHASDNFVEHGVPFKRGIVVWTALPNDSVH